MDTLDIGVIGVGGLGSHMAAQFDALDGVRIVAITDVSEEARMTGGDRFGVPESARFAEYEEMLETMGLDAVQITTPHTLHYEQIVAALERDLHVYCEKPLVTSLEQAHDLIERDGGTDRVTMVGYQRHLDPAFLAVRARYADGDHEPRFLTAEITQDLFAGDNWYLDPELSGGGQIYATGTHIIDAMLWTTGLTPVSVGATLDLDDNVSRLDKHAALTIGFENGAVGTIAISGDTRRVREHHHYWDDEGAIYVDGREWDARTVTTIDGNGTEHNPHLGVPDRSKGAAFVEAVRDGTEPPATVRDALRATVVQEAAYEADRSGRRVDVSDWYEP